jgi:excinuclease ABC subunit C
MVNTQGEVLYVGKAKNLKNRVTAYTLPEKLPHRLKRMIAETHSMEIVTTQSEVEALLLESNLIKKFQPPYNILLKDDKSFPYILITQDHAYPRALKHRGPQKIVGRYFGPFASSQAVDECLILLQKVFLLRNCTDSYFASRTRPCLQYHIKRCSAPCVQKISQEDYRESVDQAIDFINGKSNKIQQFLAHRMQAASDQLDYEQAAVYRDRIALLTRLIARQRINVGTLEEADIIAVAEQDNQTCIQVFFFRQGQNLGTQSFFLSHTEESSLPEKLSAFINQFYANREPPKLVLLNEEPQEFHLIKQSLKENYHKAIQWEIPKLGRKRDIIDHALKNAHDAIGRKQRENASIQRNLEEITDIFELAERPSRIEVYDNSHLQGSNPYGVMIVADETGFNKKFYRKFAIKSKFPEFGGDDYEMMREVMRRRFARAGQEEWTLPDLMLIDGGLGQLNAVLQVMQDLDIQGPLVVAIAKGEQRNAGRETFFMEARDPFTLPHDSSALYFLQRLRDEAHRFAIGSHRHGRQRSLFKSKLDEIPGIGPRRKKALLQHFGSVQGISSAGIQDLLRVEGINKKVAEDIFAYFHGGSGA